MIRKTYMNSLIVDPEGAHSPVRRYGSIPVTVLRRTWQANKSLRPPWFFDRARYGGILCDLASHRIDQFLYVTGSVDACVVASAVANYANPDCPGLEDFGEVWLRSERATGYARVDWYTPDGLGTWGDAD